jgi:hypothetical protein
MMDEIDLSKHPVKVLAANVVTYRALGINKQLAMLCMQELASRRKNGEEFDYESYIDEEVAKMPKTSNMDLNKLLEQVKPFFR